MARPPAGTAALLALTRAGVAHQVRAYEPDGQVQQRDGYGAAAAAALGLDPALLHKTLVAEVDGRLVLAVVPVSAHLDDRALAAAAGGKQAAMADPAAAERATGYVRGGISPLGTRAALPTFLDAGALAHPRVLVSAGRRGLQVELDPNDLARLTGATLAPLARRR